MDGTPGTTLRARRRAAADSLLRAPAVAALALLVAAGCKPVEPAPEDLDGLFQYFWAKYDEGLDEELAGAVVNAHAAVDWDAFEDVLDGELTAFSREQMDVVGMRDDADPDELAGMYLISTIPCTLEQLERVFTDPDQDELYPGDYISYDRRDTSDRAAYFAREVPQLTWDVDITAEFIAGAEYREFIHGGVRWVPALDDERSPWGPILLARTWMPEEAEFTNDGYYFTQDYQIEVHYEHTPGEVVHLYGIWRYSGLGELNTDDEIIVRNILNALAEWDENTGALCQSGDFG